VVAKGAKNGKLQCRLVHKDYSGGEASEGTKCCSQRLLGRYSTAWQLGKIRISLSFFPSDGHKSPAILPFQTLDAPHRISELSLRNKHLKQQTKADSKGSERVAAEPPFSWYCTAVGAVCKIKYIPKGMQIRPCQATP
jgi:hypothetical protein